MDKTQRSAVRKARVKEREKRWIAEYERKESRVHGPGYRLPGRSDDGEGS